MTPRHLLLSLAGIALATSPLHAAIVHVDDRPYIFNFTTESEADSSPGLFIDGGGISDYPSVWLFTYSTLYGAGGNQWNVATLGEIVTSVSSPSGGASLWYINGTLTREYLGGDSYNMSDPFNGIGSTYYLKLAFDISGSTHYGWLELQNVGGEGHFTQWAYNDTPGASIQVGAIPEPSTILLSGLGLLALALRRRR